MPAISGNVTGLTDAQLGTEYVRQDGSTAINGDQTIIGNLGVSANISGAGINNAGSLIESAIIVVTAGTTSIGTTTRMVIFNATAGNVTATLPSANGLQQGIVIDLKRVDSTGNTVTLNPFGSDTIDGGASITFAANQARTLRVYASGKWGIF